MKRQIRHLVAVVFVISLIAVPVSIVAQENESYPFAAEEFQTVWERTDYPVAQLVEARTWIWGPEPHTDGILEEYVDSPTDERLVQYFDKSRMEFPWRAGLEPDSPWFITQGLLATELMTGELQLGDFTFEQHAPADIPVAGDPDDIGGPTYAVMGELMGAEVRESRTPITQVIDRDGVVSDDPDLARYGVLDSHFDEVTERNIASVFWDFMTETGTVYVDDEFIDDDLFINPFYAVGRPLTEAYWARVKLDGETQDVLIQCFERRCLTYAPGNPEGWEVESGNIGMHYYEWRYERIDRTPAGDPEVSVYVEDISMPGALAFSDDGRLFFTEVFDGTIRVVADGELLDEPFATLDIANPGRPTEYGLLGLALHPEFNENGYVYAFYTVGDEDGQPVEQRIVRFTDQDNIGVDETVIVDGLPFGPGGSHNAGRIAFGPDGMLYATLGDIEDPDLSQDPEHVAGSVLRYTEDGAVPDDNPFGPDNPVYAYGLRNSFGLAFHPETGDLFVTDNGPNGFDEVNRIVPGGNFGWPEARGIAGDPDYIDPIWATGESEAVAPTGVVVASENSIAELAGQVLFCQWNTGTLVALELDENDPDQVVAEQALPVECHLAVTEAPDGSIFAASRDTIFRYGPPVN
jgi:glucose/arabinose dehydrogenase